MKENDGTGNIEARDEWQTPEWLFDKLMLQYGFCYDCCASHVNKKTERFSGNFLKTKDVRGYAWMNPPFSKALEMFQHFFEVVKKGVIIYRCDNFEIKVWQEVIFPHADWVFIFNKRISYEGMEGSGARFPSALAGVGVEPPKNIPGKILYSSD